MSRIDKIKKIRWKKVRMAADVKKERWMA